ncbi:MAG: hypothetical protein AMJ88_01260 [Anaerolineae bacterium SM23_ 63]|nr:MAG: hypothetical protein AMJ88_01260 [Anaerolineae bacterium SM23_ 63]
MDRMKDQYPVFLDEDNILSSEEIFRPMPPNRRGEFIAWSCAIVIGLVSGAVFWQSRHISSLAIFLLIFFFVSAVLISFGNWMESHTLITLSPKQVVYQSPVRKVTLELEDIDELWVSYAGRGWRVAIRGAGGFFTYRTAAHLGGRFDQVVSIGIEQGERLAGFIRSMAQLSSPVLESDAWMCRRWS